MPTEEELSKPPNGPNEPSGPIKDPPHPSGLSRKQRRALPKHVLKQLNSLSNDELDKLYSDLRSGVNPWSV